MPPAQLPVALLHRMALANEEAAARDLLKMLAIGHRYPSGQVPPLGVTFCRDWLREGLDEDSFKFHLLTMIEVHDDDQGWSLNGVPQGGLWDLIKFIVGKVSPRESEEIYTDMYVAHQDLIGTAKVAAERRAAFDCP